MKEAILDGYILNPINGIFPVSAKMLFELPENILEGFEGDTGYEDDDDAQEVKYSIRKKRIYDNKDRIDAIAKFVVDRLVSTVYHQIKGYAKAMLAVSSIPAAIKYKKACEKYFNEITANKKYERFKEAPIYIVYSENQDYPSSNSLNGGLSEKKVLQNLKKLKKNGLIIVVDKLQTGFDEPFLHTLFLDKEIRAINAIQTISRVNRTLPPNWKKHDCKIVDFSYKNVNCANIKTAFEHFSNVVVSDFEPLKDEEKLEEFYRTLKNHELFKGYFEAFEKYQNQESNINTVLDIEDGFHTFITGNQSDAKALKKLINKYFNILNLIVFVIDLDKKYSEENFLQFWRRFNYEYNNLNRTDEIIDDVEIFFDNRIGIVAPPEEDNKPKKPKGEGTGESGKQYKFDILKAIEKRNQEEKAIEELIIDFEKKIDQFFTYVKTDNSGIRIIAKMQAQGNAFDQEEIYSDFAKVYRKFIRRNKNLGEFFERETSDSLNQLCDDFERNLKKDYYFDDSLDIASEP